MNVALASKPEPLPETSKQIEAQGQSALELLQLGDEQALLAYLSRLERAAEQEANAGVLALVRAARQAFLVRQQQEMIVQERRAAWETAVSQLQQLDDQLATLLSGFSDLLPAAALMAEPERILPALLKSVGGWLRRPAKSEAQRVVAAAATVPSVREEAVETAVVTPPLNPHAPTLVVYMLGTFRVYVNEQLVTEWVGNKSRSVFKYLVAHHPAPVHREVLMETFWPGEPEETARRNLYQVIYLIRQALASIEVTDGIKFLFSEEGSYRLNAALNLWIDTVAFEQHRQEGLAQMSHQNVKAAQHQFELASELYEGDFLSEDLYEDWPLFWREQIRQHYLELLDRLSVLHFEAERYAACNVVCRQILQLDGCREDSHRRLMRSYAALGQRHLALRQYHRCVATLAEELDVPPEQATAALYHTLAA